MGRKISGPLTQKSYVLRFETFPAVQASQAAPDTASTRTDSSARTAAQSWTYLSSDGRALWRVTLSGVFQDGLCLDAAADVEVFDAAWGCELVSCEASGTSAAAIVRACRYALGIPVAEEQIEFRINPP